MNEPIPNNVRSAIELAGDITLFAELNAVLMKRVNTKEDAVASIYALTRLAVCMAAVGTDQKEDHTRNILVTALNMNLKSHFDFVKKAAP